MPPGPFGNRDLDVTKVDSADVPLGTTFVYAITPANRGPLAATNVIVCDFLPKTAAV